MAIYEIRCTRNGRRYIGASGDVFIRWHQHLCMLANGYHGVDDLEADWKKYGPLCFRFRILEVIEDKSMLFDMEKKWIKRASKGNPYNTFCVTPLANHKRRGRRKGSSRLTHFK